VVATLEPRHGPNTTGVPRDGAPCGAPRGCRRDR
jgi:hypothetical protein